ncbi:tetratricopeptide repeat protein [Vibrio atypicus]|uniref:tetratricopeptide repeat protein n=1 Tax=Vibrio atypicus TaxID=558271 RepID=UPI003736F143
MSAINQALSELARKKGGKIAAIEPVKVKPVKQKLILPWVVGSFGLSLAVGGWAISYQAPTSEVAPEAIIPVANDRVTSAISIASPTAKMSSQSGAIYRSEQNAPAVQEAIPDEKAIQVSSSVVAEPVAQPVQLIAKVATKESANQADMVVEQVELTAGQLSDKAQQQAKKALDNNNLKEALDYYHEALKYTPQNEKVRQTLAALYYGKDEVRRAVDLLQKGISLDKESVVLRLSLAKLLMKQKQDAAALSALAAIPENATVEYLSLRGILAQKANQEVMALSSYQQLVQLDPDSGRWWLGLAIQQERALDFDQAKNSYESALRGFGLSGQSQQFIRDRLALIDQLGEQNGAN